MGNRIQSNCKTTDQQHSTLCQTPTQQIRCADAVRTGLSRSNNGQSWIITQHRKLPLIEQHYRRIVNLAERFRIIFIIVCHQFNPFFRTILYQFSDLLICDGTNAALFSLVNKRQVCFRLQDLPYFLRCFILF